MEDFIMRHGWECGTCTFQNAPLKTACEVCNSVRPPTYKLPDKRTMRPADLNIWQRMEEDVKSHEEELAKQRNEILQFDRQNAYIPNLETFVCQSCDGVTRPGEGVVLRSCTHMFCRECICDVIRHAHKEVVACPGLSDTDRMHPCNMPLQHREIKGLLGDDEAFRQRLQREISFTEGLMKPQKQSTFHCLSNNCAGWVLYENGGQQFTCDACGVRNCIPCRAQHAPLSCNEYKAELRRKDAVNKDNAYIQGLVQRGEGMSCPSCDTFIVKNGGCYFVKCTTCQLEICWGIKAARWGPNGRYDETGGCKCDYKTRKSKCVPDCPGCTYP